MSDTYPLPPENQQPSQTEIRLQLFRLGYTIIPTRGKRALLKGWNSPAFVQRELMDDAKASAEQRIAKWSKRFPHLTSTGLRIENGLAAIDIDVDDEKMTGNLLNFVEKIAPDIYARAPARYGGGRFKVGLFVRKADEGIDLAFRCKQSRKWFRPGENAANSKGHRIEIFGGANARNGNCGHHMGIYGPHDFDDSDKDPVSWYRWEPDYPELRLTRPADLPIMTTAIAQQLIDHFDGIAAQSGWQAEKLIDDSGKGDVVYDIDRETTVFETEYGAKLNYEGLCHAYDRCRGELRCTTSFLSKGDHRRRDHCIVGDNNRHGVVAVFVFGAAQLHFPKDLAPTIDAGAVEISKLLKSLREGKSGLPELSPGLPRNMTDDEKRGSSAIGFALIAERVNYLLATHAFEAGRVVNIYDQGDGMPEKAARSHFMNWRIIRDGEGPKGGNLPPVMALNNWLDDAGRLSTRGRRMRPDKTFPVYPEDGGLWRNSYRAPRHHEIVVNADQIAEAGWLLAQLIRNVAAGPGEMEYMLQHISHKMQHPAIPGCSMLFVNPVFGSGRDLLYSIVSRLLGRGNTSKQDISRLIGDGGRAAWNAWLTDYVLVYVGEVLDKEHSRSTYDRLKMLVDPRADDQVSISRKNVEEYSGVRYATTWLATNHPDAFKIEEGDRRFSVLSGGPKLDAGLAKRLEQWRDDPVNIAALYQYLLTVDLTGYVAHEPLETAAKIAMRELTMDGVRAALRLIAEDETRRWKVFSLDQLEEIVERRMGLNYASRADKLRGLSTRQKEARAGLVVPVLRADGNGQRVMRVRGEIIRVFCFAKEANKIAKSDDDTLRKLLPEGHLSEVVPFKPN